MTTNSVQTKIKLGNIKLEGYRLKDGTYAAHGLYRLTHTAIYRYGECWYWLGCNGQPDLKNCKFWGRKGDVFLAFQGNKLCYRYVNPADQESELYVPIPSDVQSAIEFCIIGKLASDKSMVRLNKVLDTLCPVRRVRIPAILSSGLLKKTATYLPEAKVSTLDAKNKSKKSPRTNNNLRNEHLTGIQSYIYLVKLDAHLKLGFTHSLSSRLGSFKTTNARVELIKLVKGTRAMEKALHSKLGSKVRELYDFEDEQRIVEAMGNVPYHR